MRDVEHLVVNVVAVLVDERVFPVGVVGRKPELPLAVARGVGRQVTGKRIAASADRRDLGKPDDVHDHFGDLRPVVGGVQDCGNGVQVRAWDRRIDRDVSPGGVGLGGTCGRLGDAGYLRCLFEDHVLDWPFCLDLGEINLAGWLDRHCWPSHQRGRAKRGCTEEGGFEQVHDLIDQQLGTPMDSM